LRLCSRVALALLITALLAIVGYIVQNKNAADTNRVQHEVVQEASERVRVEEKAGRQLERVQIQSAEFNEPIGTRVNQVIYFMLRAVQDCGMETYKSIYALECCSPPTQPYASVNMNTSMKALAANPFPCTLPPEDLERLAANPSKRAQWEQLVTHMLLPPLREMVPIIQNQVHHFQGPAVCGHKFDDARIFGAHAVALPVVREVRRARQGVAWSWS
jgi:hypothetical protein